MHPDVKKLLAVQEVDQKIGALRKDLISIPKERADRESKLEKLRAANDAAQAALRAGEVEMRGNENAIRDSDLEIKKLQERLNTVKNNAEYQAILLQIESVKKQIAQQEEDGLALIDRVEESRGVAEAAAKKLGEETEVFNEFVVKADAIIAEREGQVAEIIGGRNELAAQVPPEMLSDYERMFEARNHEVVSLVEGETCTGCYIRVPPNLQAKLHGATTVVHCDSCQRILYYPD